LAAEASWKIGSLLVLFLGVNLKFFFFFLRVEWKRRKRRKKNYKYTFVNKQILNTEDKNGEQKN